MLRPFRAYVNPAQDDWDLLLPLAEFSINNAYQSATKSTPFFMNFGCHPRTPADTDVSVRDLDIAGNPERIQGALRHAKECLKQAQHYMAHQANKRRRHVEFSVGDFVLLHSQNLKLQFDGVKKLMHRYFGPFKNFCRVGTLACELELPASMKSTTSSMCLCPSCIRGGGSGVVVPPPAVLPSGATELEKIIGHRVRDGHPELEVTWKDDSQSTWLAPEDLDNARTLLKE